jgi:lysyl-tRNA synthetase class 2
MNQTPTGKWRPAASWETLSIRAELLWAIRDFFRTAGYLEVETPLLSRETVVDSQLDPITAQLHPHRGSESETWFLQTSPEFGMKRLLADLNFGPDETPPHGLMQITKAFRDHERGRLHNPEFTMIEWYGIGETHHQQMEFTEAFVRHLTQHVIDRKRGMPQSDPRLNLSEDPFPRISYDEACERSIGCRLLSQSAQELMILCRAEGIEPPVSLDPEDRDALLNLLLAEKVEPTLGQSQPEFLFDYPASQSALARVRDEDPPVAERFELYWQGIEVCNGYHELTDPEVLKQRIRTENARRRGDSTTVLPAGELLLEAMESGLPDCSGVASGFDRLVMLLLGKTSLSDVMAFPCDRA